MENSHQGGGRKVSGTAAEPRVGIFWLVDGKLVIDSIVLCEAEPYGDHLTHPRGHAEVWGQYQRTGTVPADMDHEESPRGRVMYDTKARRFRLLADRCILRDKGVVSEIISKMKLPIKNTDKETDNHYRCSACPPARWE